MPELERIILLYETSRRSGADSTAGFELVVATEGRDVLKDLATPWPVQASVLEGLVRKSLPARMERQWIDVSRDNVNSDAKVFDISLRITDPEDGWLPESLYVIGVPSTVTSLPRLRVESPLAEGAYY